MSLTDSRWYSALVVHIRGRLLLNFFNEATENQADRESGRGRCQTGDIEIRKSSFNRLAQEFNGSVAIPLPAELIALAEF